MSQRPQPVGGSEYSANATDGVDSPQASLEAIESMHIYGNFAGTELWDESDPHAQSMRRPIPPPEVDARSARSSTRDLRTVIGSGTELTPRRRMAASDAEGENDDAITGLLSPRLSNSPEPQAGPHSHRAHQRQSMASARATPSQVLMILIKSFIGTGVLVLPSAFKQGGLGFSAIFMLFVAILSTHGMVLLVQVNEVIPGSFGEIMGILVGRKMELLVVWSIALSQLGFSVAYFIFVCENFNYLTSILNLPQNHIFAIAPAIIGFQTLFYAPVALVRHLKRLSFLSLIADVLIAIGLFSVIFFAMQKLTFGDGIDPTVIPWFNPAEFHLYIGKSIYAFEGVALILPIAQSLQEPRSRFPRLLWISVVATTATYLLVAVTGYLAFGNNTKDVILGNLPKETPRTTAVIILLYIIAVMFSWPLVLFPATRIIEKALLPGRDGRTSLYHKWQKNTLRLMLVICLACIAMVFSNYLNRVIAFLGAFACIPLAFVYPAIIHLKAIDKFSESRVASVSTPILPQREPAEDGFALEHAASALRAQLNSRIRLKILIFVDKFMIVFGLIGMVYVTWQTIFSQNN